MKIVKEISSEITTKELIDHLQKRIDIRMTSFIESYDKLKTINDEIEQLEERMVEIIFELEPIESLIYNQNPQLKRIFESLKLVYRKEENGID